MITNRLTDNYFTLGVFDAAGGWRAGDGTIISDGGPTELTPTLNCRQLKLSGGLTNEIYIDALPGDSALGNTRAVFVFALKVPNGGICTVTIEDAATSGSANTHQFPIGASTPSINADGVASPQWSIIRIISDVFSYAIPAITLTVNILKNEDEDVYFSSPVLYPQMELFTKSFTLRQIGTLLPQFMVEDDLSTTEPIDMPLFRFIDVASVGLDSIITETLNSAYVDIIEGRDDNDPDTLSTFVDPRVAEVSNLVWLAKFVGTKPITRFSYSQEVFTSPFELDISELDGADTLRLTSFSALNPPPLDAQAQLELLKWQLTTKNYGFNAGTTNSVIEAAKLMMIGEKTVTAIYDYVANPFEIELQTSWTETLGAEESQIGEPSPLLLEAVRRTKPLGVLLTHVLTA